MRAGVTGGDLTAAAMAVCGGARPWMPHFYLGHGLGLDAAEMPFVGTDLGDDFDSGARPHGRHGHRDRADRVGRRAQRLPVGKRLRRHRRRLHQSERLPLRPLRILRWRLKYCPTTGPCGSPAANGRSRPWRSTTSTCSCSAALPTSATSPGCPLLWNAGARPFGPGCVLLRSGDIHLLSTWDEGVPDEIPHEHLYGITWNPMNLVSVLQRIGEANRPRRVGTDALSPLFAKLLPMAFPDAEVVDGEPALRQARMVKTDDEVAAIRVAIDVAEAGLAAAVAQLRPASAGASSSRFSWRRSRRSGSRLRRPRTSCGSRRARSGRTSDRIEAGRPRRVRRRSGRQRLHR